MNTRRLGQIMARFGAAGTLYVGAYLLIYHIWKNRRARVQAAVILAVALLTALSLCVFRPSAGSKPVDRPQSEHPRQIASMPHEQPDSVEAKGEMRDRLEQSLQFQEGTDRWRLEIWTPPQADEPCVEAYLQWFKNGRLVRKTGALGLGGVSLEFGKPSFATRFPLIVIRAEPACGHPGPISLFSIRQGRIVKIGEVGGENGGPVFRDYDGDRKPEWVFDDYCWYSDSPELPLGAPPKHFLVYKESKTGELKLWKRLPNPKRRRLPYRLGLNRWD